MTGAVEDFVARLVDTADDVEPMPDADPHYMDQGYAAAAVLREAALLITQLDTLPEIEGFLSALPCGSRAPHPVHVWMRESDGLKWFCGGHR